MSELRSIAEFCNFGNMLEDMLRDKLVCGIADNVIQKRLLAEDPLTLAMVLENAKGMKSAAKNSATLNPDHQSISTQGPVHQVRTSSTVTSCYCCGRQGHQPRACKFKEANRFSCSNIGHLKKYAGRRQ